MSATAGDSAAIGATPGEYVSSWKDDEVRELGALADKFIAAELTARRDTWESQHYVDPEVWRRAGEIGLLCCSIPAEYGGGDGEMVADRTAGHRHRPLPPAVRRVWLHA
jgi:alkylation response protein AidB-like acyl-CoA dehydrogenase